MVQKKGVRQRLRRQRRRRRKNNMIVMDEQIIIRILEFIPNRTDWNSVARCNKYIYNISQGILLPPWPTNFKLRVPAADYESDQKYTFLDRPTWSPDGTQIAGSAGGKIIIFDQRRGRLRFRHHGDNNNNSNINEIGWIAHDPTRNMNSEIRLIYSPDGSVLVSAASRPDWTLKIWKYNTNGDYKLIQEWNAHTDSTRNLYTACNFDISPCSKYIVVIVEQQILLKNIQNLKETIKSIVLPAWNFDDNVMFCKNDDHCSIFINIYDDETGEESIKIWHPYDAIDDEDDPDTTASLITIWESSVVSDYYQFALSHDNSMMAIFAHDKVMLYSVDNDTKSTALIQSVPANCGLDSMLNSIYFTPDDKCIVYTKAGCGLAFLYITTRKEITDQIKMTYNVNIKPRRCTKITVFFSPAGGAIRRLLVKDHNDTGYCIASYWEK